MTDLVNTNARNTRIESIDFLRGAVMIIMALDHVRDYFHFDSFLYSPTDLSHTSAGLFATRWVTHLCAPTFILLAGASAYFIAQRKTLRDTSIFLLTRGTWLVILQLTVIRFGWSFDPLFHFNSNSIISIIGLCMIFLSVLIHFPIRTIFIFSILVIAGHNALDNISFPPGTVKDVLWTFLHGQKTYNLGDGYAFSFIYPLIPWIAVMSLGFCLGYVYDTYAAPEKRKAILLDVGLVSLILFAVLRCANIYGDPLPWNLHHESAGTVMSFFNLAKYPPSLLYLCATLGISCIVLALAEGKDLSSARPITLFGKVALFYYVAHIYMIHSLATLAVVLLGYPWQTMIFPGPITEISPLLKGSYGFPLWGVYLIWMSIVALLYPLCVFWNNLKIKNKRKWWVSYV